MRKLVLVFVGYKGHWVDCIAPVIGEHIKRRYNIPVFLCNQQQIGVIYNELRKFDEKKYKIIAFDVGLLKTDNKYAFTKGIAPASLVKEEQKVVLGEVGVIINVSKIATIRDFKEDIYKTPCRKKLKERNKIIKNTLRNVESIIRVSEDYNVL